MYELIEFHNRLKIRIERKLDEATRLHAEIDTLIEIKGIVEDMLKHGDYILVRDHWEKVNEQEETKNNG